MPEAVDGVLQEIGAADVPRCLVFNKIDQAQRGAGVERAACGRIGAVWLSARSGDGLELLLQRDRATCTRADF